MSKLSKDSISKIKITYRFDMPIKKINEEQRIVAGYASVELIDKQNEVIPLDALREAWGRFWKNQEFAIGMVMHSNIPIAKVIAEFTESNGTVHKSGVDDTGLYIVSKIRDDIRKANEVWDLINSEPPELVGYSIGGEALLRSTVCDGKTCHDQIDELEIHEISIVDNPANQSSLFTVLKRFEPEKEDVVSKPFAGFKDHADCVRRNKDKRDPHAFCAWLERRTKKYEDLMKFLEDDDFKEVIKEIIDSELHGGAIQSGDPKTVGKRQDSASCSKNYAESKIKIKVRLDND